MLYCDDVERARDFWVGVVGLTPLKEVPGLFCILGTGSVRITLEQAAIVGGNVGAVHFMFRADEDGLQSRATSAGVETFRWGLGLRVLGTEGELVTVSPYFQFPQEPLVPTLDSWNGRLRRFNNSPSPFPHDH